METRMVIVCETDESDCRSAGVEKRNEGDLSLGENLFFLEQEKSSLFACEADHKTLNHFAATSGCNGQRIRRGREAHTHEHTVRGEAMMNQSRALAHAAD
jgi:hypothetical protein